MTGAANNSMGPAAQVPRLRPDRVSQMLAVNQFGVEIDHQCAGCREVFLDRDEMGQLTYDKRRGGGGFLGSLLGERELRGHHGGRRGHH